MDVEIIDDLLNSPHLLDQLEEYLSSESSTLCDVSIDHSSMDFPRSPLSSFDDTISCNELMVTPQRVFDSCVPRRRTPAKPLIQSPQFYARHIINALNSHDSNYMFHCLRRLSSPRLKITKQVYSYATDRGLQENIFGSLEEFCQFMEVWNMFLPDGVFESSSHRQCAVNSLTSVFISTLYFSGQKVVKGVDVLNDDLCLYYPRLHEMMVNTIDGRKYPDIVELSGSLVTYINTMGLIEKIEIFCCQMEQ
eukprot:gene11393-12420_t